MKINSANFFESEFAKKSRFHWDFISKIELIDKWLFLSDQYNNFLIEKNISINKKHLIPKIIHQIWIGKKKLPKKYKIYMSTWKKFNKDWDYILWDDEKVSKLKLKNHDAYHNSNNYGYKSDILRYEILHEIGGLYADTDFECLKTIPENILTYDFIVSMMFNNKPILGNALILSSPRNRLIKRIIDNILPLNGNSTFEVFKNSGPYYITEKYFLSSVRESQSYLILPSNYLYPKPNFLEGNFYNKFQFAKEYSFAIHHWGKSWFKDSKITSILKMIYKLLNLKKLKNIFINLKN